MENKMQYSLLERIFSVKNYENHKILTILGIKIKFKMNNLHAKEEVNPVDISNLQLSEQNVDTADYQEISNTDNTIISEDAINTESTDLNENSCFAESNEQKDEIPQEEIIVTIPAIKITAGLNTPIDIKECPFCGSKEYFLLKEFSINSLKERWEKEFNIIPYDECYENKSLEKRECKNCHLQYYNYKIPDLPELYEHIYLSLAEPYTRYKWEYERSIELIKQFNPDSVLDIGCGYGYFIEKIHNAVANVMGIEFNPDALAVCQKKSFNVCSIDIKDMEEKFDMICAFQVLEHAADIRNFIENSLRLLNEKGLLCIAVPNPKCIFVKETPGLLELPPHHCLDINKEFFEYLSKIFPIEIISYETEELDFVYYKDILEYKLNQSLSNFYSENIIQYYQAYLADKQSYKGKSHFICFQKRG